MLDSCRICLIIIGQAECISIYHKATDNKTVLEIIKECSSIEVLENDNLPKYICPKCVETLNSLYSFRNLIIKNDFELKKQLVIKNEPPEIFLPQYVVEYEKFSEGLPDNVKCESCKPKEIVGNFTKVMLSEKSPLDESREKSSDREEADVKNPKLKELLVNIEVNENISVEQMSDNSVTQPVVLALEDLNKKGSINVKKTYECEMCHKVFKASSILKKHIMVHTGVRPYTCDMCGKGFVENCALNIHRRIHTGEKPLSCKHCGKKFRSPSGLISHKSVHETERRFNCQICNLGFYLASQLDLHMRRHTGEKPFMCEICSQMLCDKATLIRHKKRHHLSQDDQLPCPVCGKAFRSQAHLQDHVKRHGRLKSFECDDCGQKFTARSSLKTHKLVHSGIKPFKCKVCEKSFSQRSTLVRHMRIHSGEKPFPCPLCPKEFAYKHHLATHTRSHHKDALEETPATADESGSPNSPG